MPISRELRAAALKTTHHQRRALMLLGTEQNPARGMNGVGRATLQALLAAGLVVEDGNAAETFNLQLSGRGREIYGALKELGWFPPDPRTQRF